MSHVKTNPQMVLRPQDVVMLLGLSLKRDAAPTYAALAGELKATRGGLTRGVPTGYAAPPLKALIVQPASEPAPVWPHKAGTVRGAAFYPLYPTVPEAALANPALYKLLGLVDAVRGGSPRERAISIAELEKRWAA